jgi:hypothetical protein
MLEGGGEVVKELLQVGVVLLVLLVGVRGLCNGGATARLSGGGALSSSALWGMVLRCGKMKLNGLRSTSGSR